MGWPAILVAASQLSLVKKGLAWTGSTVLGCVFSYTVFIANAKYTDDTKVGLVADFDKQLAVEKAERVAWQTARKEYGDRFMLENDAKWNRQHSDNERMFKMLDDVHKDVKLLLNKNP